MMFRNEYDFLSNFYPCRIRYGDLVFPSVEHAFQAMKSKDPNVWKQFTSGSPAQAKKLGRRIKLRPDWESIKLPLMKNLLLAKFSRSDLKLKLKATAPLHLEETNTWGDTYWGVTPQGYGKNHLGKLLMEVRDTLE